MIDKTFEPTYFHCGRCGYSWLPRAPVQPKVCPLCKSPYWNKPRKISSGGVKMQNCPVCMEEHTTFLNLSSHMVLLERREQGEHQEYLTLLTGEPFAEYAFHNDRTIAVLLQKYYKKLRRLPTLDELEEARETKQGSTENKKVISLKSLMRGNNIL